ncbi:lrgB-like family protein, partial [Vibrio parahaemolyticus 10296]
RSELFWFSSLAISISHCDGQSSFRQAVTFLFSS